MNRRNILIAAVALPGVAYLGACAQTPSIITDANIIANGITAVLPTIKGLIGMSDVIAAKISDAVAGIQAAAVTLGSATSAGAMTAAQRIQTGVSTIASLLSTVKVPAWISAVIGAAQTLAPILLQASGLLVALAPDPQAVKQARAVLLAAASA